MISIRYETAPPRRTGLERCIECSDKKTWHAADRRVIPVAKMSASHLVNTVLLLRASFESLRENEFADLIGLDDGGPRFDKIKGMTCEEYLLDRVRPYRAMIARLRRNGFDTDNLQRIDFDELESPQPTRAERRRRIDLERRRKRLLDFKRIAIANDMQFED